MDEAIDPLLEWKKNSDNATKFAAALEREPVFREVLTYIRLHPRKPTPPLGHLLEAEPGFWGYLRGLTDGAEQQIIDILEMAVAPKPKQKLPEPDFGVKDPKKP